MKYKLIGPKTSPFVRGLRLLFVQHSISYEFKNIDYFNSKEDADFLARVNPINKIPVLVISDEKSEQPLYDSRVIFNYLSQEYHWPTLTLNEENTLSAIYGAADTTVNLFLLQRGGSDVFSKNDNWYVQRQKDRTQAVLNFLLPWVSDLDPAVEKDWNFLSMSFFSYAYWANKRGALDLKTNPDIAAFLERFSKKPGVAETDGFGV